MGVSLFCLLLDLIVDSQQSTVIYRHSVWLSVRHFCAITQCVSMCHLWSLLTTTHHDWHKCVCVLAFIVSMCHYSATCNEHSPRLTNIFYHHSRSLTQHCFCASHHRQHVLYSTAYNNHSHKLTQIIIPSNASVCTRCHEHQFHHCSPGYANNETK